MVGQAPLVTGVASLSSRLVIEVGLRRPSMQWWRWVERT